MTRTSAATSLGVVADPRLARRLPRPVRVHRADRGEGPAGGGRSSTSPGRASSQLVREPRRGRARRATTCSSPRSSTARSSRSASVADHGRPRRDGRLRAAAPPGPAGRRSQLPRPGRPHHPAGRRADDLGACRAWASSRPCPGLILIEVAFGLSFCVLLFRAFIATIPRELDEAALIDGAGPLRLFFRVIFPLLRSVIVTVIVVQSVVVFNDFQNPLYFLPGDENATVQLTLYNFQSQFNHAVEPAVHGHPADHHPAAAHVHVLQPPDRRRADRPAPSRAERGCIMTQPNRHVRAVSSTASATPHRRRPTRPRLSWKTRDRRPGLGAGRGRARAGRPTASSRRDGGRSRESVLVAWPFAALQPARPAAALRVRVTGTDGAGRRGATRWR